MIYQNILAEASPYQAKVGNLAGFKEHRHADIELSYCMEGELYVEIDKKSYTLKSGDMLLVSPMAAHSYPYPQNGNNLVLTVILGVSFLKNFFSYFREAKNSCYVFSKHEMRNEYRELFRALDETCDLTERKRENKELLIRGNLYKICAYLIDLTGGFENSTSTSNKRMTKVGNIEKALELIYYNHTNRITVDDAAAATGYAKSNFCKIFKDITGDTFHNMLNKKRVESAKALLKQTNMPISEVAIAVGFAEAKSFCRVFKAITALTPNEYRKEKNSD